MRLIDGVRSKSLLVVNYNRSCDYPGVRLSAGTVSSVFDRGGAVNEFAFIFSFFLFCFCDIAYYFIRNDKVIMKGIHSNINEICLQCTVICITFSICWSFGFVLVLLVLGTQPGGHSHMEVTGMSLETSLICILLLASRDVYFDKRMICFLSDLLLKAHQSQNHKEKHIISRTHRFYVIFKSSLYVILWYAFMNRLTV